MLQATGMQTTHDLMKNKAMLLNAVRELQAHVSKEQRSLVFGMIGQFLSINTAMAITDLKQELLARIRDAAAPEAADSHPADAGE